MNTKERSKQWELDEFEDIVARALIACFESRVLTDKRCGKNHSVQSDVLPTLRKVGPFIPGKSRIVIEEQRTLRKGLMAQCHNLLPTDPIPNRAVIAIPNGTHEAYRDSYFNMHVLRRVSKLPRKWHRMESGILYELDIVVTLPKGISGVRAFVTVTKDGLVVP